MNNNSKVYNFINKSAVIVCHDFIYGPPHELRDYMLFCGIKELLFIGHVNRYVAINSIAQSYCEHWINGKLVKKYYGLNHHLPEMFSYIIDLFYSIFWPLKIIRQSIDIYFGAGNINAFAGLVLVFFRKAKKSIYYVIDYASIRFSNKVLNYLYHLTDAVCAFYSSLTWNYSKAMIDERSIKWNHIFKRQIIVPNGIRIRKDIIVSLNRSNIHEIIYMGTLNGYQGVDTTIRSLKTISKAYHDVTFTIIGDGVQRKPLETLAHQLNLERKVRFTGFIEDPREMESQIAQSSIGVACYDTRHPLVFTGEPGKVKRYLACGIPVIMTNVSPLAHEIEKYKCGMIVKNSSQSLAKAILSFFNDKERMRKYRRNATIYAANFEWNKLFQKAFQSIEK